MNVEDRIKRHHVTINIITVKRTNVMCGSFNVQNVVFFFAAAVAAVAVDDFAIHTLYLVLC